MHATDMQVNSRGNHAVRIVQQSFADHIRRGSGRDAALAVIQNTHLHRQGTRASMLDLAILVGDGDGIDVQVPAVDCDTAGSVVQIAGNDGRIARARLQDGAFGVVQVCHVQVELACLQCPFRVVQSRVGRDVERARRRDDCLAGTDIA
ncbi:hypothetical protein D3C85_368010 [compost metagenome]